MNIQELLKGVDCACGKHHACDIGYVAIERGAIDHLKKLCDVGLAKCADGVYHVQIRIH